ncbi:MAG: hypothetical protein NXH75_04135 [Halobacteriovoraceae bacterium]|nr:hypothetical protein [Halobacteriovoraceae bacterium]
MKLFTLFLTTLFLFPSSAGLNAKRERIFHCMDFGRVIHVKELFIVESKKGSRTYYEVEVPYKTLDGEKKTFFRKLNFISKYEGRVLEFTTGNYRVKIDRAMPVEKKYKAFVRLPRFDIHSTHWFCKDY